MPSPQIWGPLAWSLFHSIGARAGRGKQIKLKKDEEREIIWLLSHLEFIIPCQECRQHISSYRNKYGLPQSAELVGSWLWTFHEAVNERLNKSPGPPFTHSLGADQNPDILWKEYKVCVKESFTLGHLRMADVTTWGRHFYLWLATL